MFCAHHHLIAHLLEIKKTSWFAILAYSVQCCWPFIDFNIRGIKLMRHNIKKWDRVFEARLRREIMICEHYRCDVFFESSDGEV